VVIVYFINFKVHFTLCKAFIKLKNAFVVLLENVRALEECDTMRDLIPTEVKETFSIQPLDSVFEHSTRVRISSFTVPRRIILVDS